MSFGESAYREKMSAQNPDLYRELQKFDELKLGSSPSSFVVCVKSIKDNIAMCDNSATGVMDRVKVETPLPDLNSLMDQVRGP